MHFAATTLVHARADAVWSAVSDLGTYPRWLGIVALAVPEPRHADDGGRPAWLVTLQARLGPLVRRKRVRMVRVEPGPAGGPEEAIAAAPVGASEHAATLAAPVWTVRFERAELDGRTHSSWTLAVTVSPPRHPPQPDHPEVERATSRSGDHRPTRLEVELHYDGLAWGPGLDLLLREEARTAGRRLEALLAT